MIKNRINKTKQVFEKNKDKIVVAGTMTVAAAGSLYLFALGYRVGKDAHEPAMGALFKHADDNSYTFITNSKTGQVKQFDVPNPDNK